MKKSIKLQRWARVPVDLCIPACPRSSIFPLRSALPRSCTTFFAFPCAPAFLFRVPSVCVGEQIITLVLCVYGRIRRARSTCHHATTPPSSGVPGVRVYWREACLRSNSCLVHNPPLDLSSQYEYMS